MLNLMLDRLPDNYKGYLIRTDFRVGIQIVQALQDAELTEQERGAVALTLLFGMGVPADAETARNGIRWFLSGGNEDSPKETAENDQRSFDFDIDHARLWSGFYRVYGIDLGTAKIHWFQFLAMIADLKDSAFSDIIGYRTADTSKMPADMKRAYQRMKDLYALKPSYTPEEQGVIDEFMSKLKGCAEPQNTV